jgi:transcriptional regulator with XRE-family HTH domain
MQMSSATTVVYVLHAAVNAMKEMNVSDLNPEYLEVVNTLKYVRLLKGYTLEHVELVTNGEFTKEAVGSYERNSRNITLRRLLKLCDVYGVSIDTIIRSSMYGDPIHVTRRRNYELRTTA